jgi:alkylhydroperoxidase family enzyme
LVFVERHCQDEARREKAALAYADLFATNHLAIDDGTFETLREHFSEAEIVELAMFVASFGSSSCAVSG